VTVAACGGGPTFEHGLPEANAALDAALEAGSGMAAFESLLARYPSSYEVKLEYAHRAASAGNNAQALQTFEELSRADSADKAAARKLAALCLFVGQLDRAAVPIASLLLDQPTSDDQVLAARLAHARGDLVEAEARGRAAVAADSKNSAAHFELALILLDGEAPESPAVEAELKAALASDPGLAEAHYALGTWLLQADDEAAGKRQLETSQLARELTAPAFLKVAPQERMQRAYQIGARLPKWSQPLLEIARAELELGRPKKAEASLALAAKLVPNTPERAKLLYATAKARGDQAQAKKRLKEWRAARLAAL